MKKCKYADKYKAMRPPKCNNGTPCKVCQEKWDAKVRTLIELIKRA